MNETPEENAPHPDATVNARVSKTELVIGLLLAGHPVATVAEQAHMNRSTLWRLRQTEAFQTAFREAQSELLYGAIAALHGHSLMFVRALAEVAGNTEARGTERAAAAREGLAALFRAKELVELDRRIAALEEATDEPSE